MEDVSSDVWINGAESIINEVDGGTLVDCASQVHSLLLTSAQVRTLSTAVKQWFHVGASPDLHVRVTVRVRV